MSVHSAAGAAATHTSTRLRVPETVRVVSWPLRDGGLAVWLTAIAIAGVAGAAGLVSQNWAMGTICFAALTLSSWRLWLPVTFELGTKGVTQSTLVLRWRIPWRSFARYEKRPQGVWLFAGAEPTPFASLRGVYVPWADDEERVLAVLDFFLSARRARAPVSTRTFVP